MEKPYEDPVVAEFRAVKEAYAKEFNYDNHAIYKDIKACQAASGRTYVNWERKPASSGKQGSDDDPSTGAQERPDPSDKSS